MVVDWLRWLIVECCCAGVPPLWLCCECMVVVYCCCGCLCVCGRVWAADVWSLLLCVCVYHCSGHDRLGGWPHRMWNRDVIASLNISLRALAGFLDRDRLLWERKTTDCAEKAVNGVKLITKTTRGWNAILGSTDHIFALPTSRRAPTGIPV